MVQNQAKMTPEKRKCKNPQEIWELFSVKLVNFVEHIFYRLGILVGKNPWKTIIFSWVLVFISCIGLYRFHIEKNPMNLWVPPDSDFYADTNWYIEKFGTGFRFQRIILTADNVLEPHVFKALNEMTNKVNSIEINHNNVSYSIKDLCFKVPVVNFMSSDSSDKSNSSTSKRDVANTKTDYSDATLWLDYEFYCSFIENFPYICLQQNILDLWKNDKNVIESLNKHDIVQKINNYKVNPMTGHPMDYTKFLGGIEYDNNGDVVKAKSVMVVWYTHVNMSEVDLNEVGNLIGTEEWVSIPLAMWEQEYLDLMNAQKQNASDMDIFYEAGRSFGDVSGEAMFQEFDKLSIGIVMMFIYIQLALSRCNWLEVKLTLGGVGLLSVGMAYMTAVGFCSALGISFGPVHSSLPFLLMGLGIDDMFVMKSCWEHLTADEMKKSLPVRIGCMLKHAGVSIVITSFTDIVALLIGAITILPSLKSFCIYAAAGVFFVFVYSVTFYVAVMTLDHRRVEDNRNSILVWYRHKKPVKLPRGKSIFQKFWYQFYSKVVFTTPAKILIIIFTIVMTGFSIQAVLNLEQRFDPRWFIPEGTYYKDFIDKQEQYYAEDGNMAMIFLGEMKYNEEFPILYDMVKKFQNQTYVKDVVSWIEYFHGYMLQNYDKDIINNPLTDEEFHRYMSRFLLSPIGGRFQLNFVFSEPLKCGQPIANVTASSLAFYFKRFNGPDEYIPAMNYAKDLIKDTQIETGDGYRSVWSKAFANWVTDEVIAVEVERNIELALLCVMACTIVLITNLQMCIWIFLCVLLTIVNVLGWMQRWGMTVDIVCCIGLELAIGLCVDYAAHVGHTFLTISEGSRNKRAFKTVTSIGTAVMLGGGATFLALSLLSFSKAYTFQSFFKIFLLVIVFGLFNGLLFLPVMLSLIGPNAYKPEKEKEPALPEAQELNGKPHFDEKE